MIDGDWIADDGIQAQKDGSFKRQPSVLRRLVSDQSEADFPAESARYHLYVAWNCPWAHRTVLMRTLKGLEDHIGLSVAAPGRTDQGWVFDTDNGYVDHVFGSRYVHEIYTRGASDYSGRVTVPILFDTKTDKIVSNESADIVRMFDQSFSTFANKTDFYPKTLCDQIDRWNNRIYHGLNNGVYQAGFAQTQQAYDKAVHEVFATLDEIEDQLTQTPYLTGDRMTEADIRLFPTLVRFDVGYYSAFKCNRNRLTDFPHLWHYAKKIYQMRGIKETVFFDIYRRGYNSTSSKRNIYGIVPAAPEIEWES